MSDASWGPWFAVWTPAGEQRREVHLPPNMTWYAARAAASVLFGCDPQSITVLPAPQNVLACVMDDAEERALAVAKLKWSASPGPSPKPRKPVCAKLKRKKRRAA